SALDTVRPDYTLATDGRAPQPIAAAGDVAPGRDLFWGSLLVDLPKDGSAIPIPSVAPGMRVLAAQVEPKARITFLGDGAGNSYARGGAARAAGQRRIVFLVDAPQVYFAARVPGGLRVADVARARAPAPLPPGVRKSAQMVLDRIGVTPGEPLD